MLRPTTRGVGYHHLTPFPEKFLPAMHFHNQNIQWKYRDVKFGQFSAQLSLYLLISRVQEFHSGCRSCSVAGEVAPVSVPRQ